MDQCHKQSSRAESDRPTGQRSEGGETRNHQPSNKRAKVEKRG